MRNFVRNYFPFFLLVLFIGHFSLSLIYSAPEQIVPEFIRQKTRGYTLPLFEQYWSLFAPAPKTNKHLFYRTEKGRWKSPTMELLTEARKNRLSSSSRKIVLYSNLLYYITEENCSCSKNKQRVVTGKPTASFNALRYLLKREIGGESGPRVDICVWADIYEKPFQSKKESVMIIYKDVDL
jgi:hypothetical protein